MCWIYWSGSRSRPAPGCCRASYVSLDQLGLAWPANRRPSPHPTVFVSRGCLLQPTLMALEAIPHLSPTSPLLDSIVILLLRSPVFESSLRLPNSPTVGCGPPDLSSSTEEVAEIPDDPNHPLCQETSPHVHVSLISRPQMAGIVRKPDARLSLQQAQSLQGIIRWQEEKIQVGS